MSSDNIYDALESTTEIAKCPSCGANMEYSPSRSSLLCPYCGATKAVNLNDVSSEIQIENLFKESSNSWNDETHVFRCNNCGAKEVLNRTDLATKCPFCGTTNVVEIEELPGSKPNGIVPFKIEKDEAIASAITWAKKRFYAPRKFKKSVSTESVSSTYSPSYSFDSKTESHYKGRLGEYHYETVTRNGKTVQKRYTKWFNISGTYNLNFDDLLIHATDSISQKNLEKLGNFDTNNSMLYNSSFLHGYSANSADRSGMECYEDAKRIMNERIKKAILKQYNYDVIDYINIDTIFDEITYKNLLLPIYVGFYNYNKKLFNFFVNGFNGTVTGKTPLSIIKVGITVILVLIVLFLIGYLIYIS